MPDTSDLAAAIAAVRRAADDNEWLNAQDAPHLRIAQRVLEALADDATIERMCRAMAIAEGAYQLPIDDALWAEHWSWYIGGRGNGGAADASFQARLDRSARAALAALLARAGGGDG